MFDWLKGQGAPTGDPKTEILKTVTTSRNGKVSKAIESFKTCDPGVRAEIVQQTAYEEITEGVVRLVAYAFHQDPDPYVRKVASNLCQARVPLRMQVLQFDVVA
jgi:hypothetical protein